MELYSKVSSLLAQLLTRKYSSSFSSASRLFPKQVQIHIYNIYGLVRVADEIVDTYDGNGKRALLDNLEQEVYDAIERGFSANPIVQAFSETAKSNAITKELIAPFFESMRMDISQKSFNKQEYETYIYGSAEVIGLMCLKVFCEHSGGTYKTLKPGAQRLGAAYQKVNFLRDMAADYMELGRVYFPNVTYENFNEHEKLAIINDIHTDFRRSIFIYF